MLWLQLVIVFLLIVVNGFFALAEMAVVSARKTRLQHAAEEGRAGATVALELKRDPGRFFSTVQIGITVIGVLTGVFGGATIADTLGREIEPIPGWVGEHAHVVAVAAVVALISFFTLILGELVPKRLALRRPAALAARLSGVLLTLARVVTPLEWVLSAISDFILRLLPLRAPEPNAVTEQEIALLLREATAAGHFEKTETEIVEMALRLGDRRVSTVMTPRTKIESLDLTDSEAESRRRIIASPFSRFPVVEGDSRRLVGVVQVKELLSAMLTDKPFDLKSVMKPPFYVPENVTALRALEIFRKSGAAMMFVVDEYGDFEGVLTLHDILQALIGDIKTPAGQQIEIERRPDGSLLVDGLTPIAELQEIGDLGDLLVHEPGEDFDTLGGFIMARVARIPMVGDKVQVGGARFEVTAMEGRRVERVLIVPPKKGETPST
jgi:putative hemolysin